MRIIFNALKTNLGNTGGCRTIVKSRDALRRMGHDCDIVATKSKYTWEKVDVLSAVPRCDICIAISVLDIDNTRKAPADIRALWLRGPEWRWLMDEKLALEKLARIQVVCNSAWLVEYLYDHKINAALCYAGMDIEFWQNTVKKRWKTIGCLYSSRESKQWKDFVSLAKVLGDKYQYFAFGLEKCKDAFLNEYYQNPSPDKLRGFYNRCKYWFAPSALEGFHNPPAEALLCGALPVVADLRRGGTADYIQDKVTGLRYADLAQAVEQIEQIEVNDFARQSYITMGRTMLQSIGTREQAMERMIKTLTGSTK